MNLFKTRKFKLVILPIAVAVLALVIITAARTAEADSKVRELIIKIEPDTGLYFVSTNDVMDLINGGSSQSVKDRSIASIAPAYIEQQLKQNPYVENCEAYSTPYGSLTIKINQRAPVLRIINYYGQSYYLDKKGVKIPFSDKFSPHVLVATGAILEKLTDSTKVSSTILLQALMISEIIMKDKLWKAQFEQLYVDNSGDWLLIPRVGNHTIVIGKAEFLDEKFEKLRQFYARALGSTGWDNYKCINLAFKNQVIGVRKETNDSNDVQ